VEHLIARKTEADLKERLLELQETFTKVQWVKLITQFMSSYVKNTITIKVESHTQLVYQKGACS